MGSLQKAVEFAEARFADPIMRFVAISNFTPSVTRGPSRFRTVQLHRDRDGLYVRLGKCRTIKKYLRDMAGASNCGSLYAFHVWEA